MSLEEVRLRRMFVSRREGRQGTARRRLLLCAALAALAALAATVRPAAACDSCGGRRDWCETRVGCCDPFGFVGFLDYRRSLDPCDDPGYRHYRRALDRDLDYAFHCMSPREASCLWYGGRGNGWQRSGCGDSCARQVKCTSHWGGGEHHHAWGVHSSDHCD